MSILSDITIAKLCGVDLKELYKPVDSFGPMISPFVPYAVREEPWAIGGENSTCVESGMKKIVSYGLSGYGYDVRLGNKFKIFTNVKNSLIDPLNPDDDCYHDHEGDFCIIPPNSYILGHTVETFEIPRDVMVVCVGKSTYARLGAIVNVTPIEPGFKGTVVIEISNATNLPLKVYANQGISQFLFFKGDRPCMTSYADKGGKYMLQTGVQTALI